MKDDKMKILCKWCNVPTHCHIVSEKIAEHQGAYGIDDVKMAKIKIHMHFKGGNYCKGADRIITVPKNKISEDKIYYH